MKKQKNGFLLVCSLVLVAACLFSLFSGLKGLGAVNEIKTYKTTQKEDGLASIKLLRDGISQLKANEKAYTTGVGTYSAGLSSYVAGQQKLAAAAQQLDAGEASYAAGQQKLAAGKQAYATGKATLDANTDAYNQGKQKLALVTPIYNIAKATGVDPLGIITQVEDGQAQIKQYEDGQAQLAEGAQTIADGEKSLAEGKQTLTSGYAQYNAGVDQLKAGAAKLASGKAQLSVFEDGEDQVAAGIDQLMAIEPIVRKDGTTAVKSVAERLGDNYSYWAKNSDGTIKQYNGHNFLDLDACLKACDAGEAYINDQGEDVTPELTSRAYLYLAMFVIMLLGLIAGIKGADAAFAPKRLEGTAFLGMVVAILAVGANVYGLINRYNAYTYPLEDGTYSGTLQFVSLLVLAGAAILFALVCYSAFKSYKAAVAAGAADGPVADVDDATVLDDGAAAETVSATQLDADSENEIKLKKLEKQEAELKEMLASLSGKISDIKKQNS
jgi:X-X-X-Leu-X-X-Gly heptad repeat protein